MQNQSSRTLYSVKLSKNIVLIERASGDNNWIIIYARFRHLSPNRPSCFNCHPFTNNLLNWVTFVLQIVTFRHWWSPCQTGSDKEVFSRSKIKHTTVYWKEGLFWLNATKHAHIQSSGAVCKSRWPYLVECCFTSTETVGLLGTGAQDVHLDFHTAPSFAL